MSIIAADFDGYDCKDSYESLQDSYFTGLDEAATDYLDTASATEILIFDCERGISVNIGFFENHYPGMAQTLRTFVIQHPEFAVLIQPIVDYDPEFASAGNICFKRDGEKIKYCLTLSPMYKDQEEKKIPGELTLELFRKFATLTEPFGGFMTEGYRPLNF